MRKCIRTSIEVEYADGESKSLHSYCEDLRRAFGVHSCDPVQLPDAWEDEECVLTHQIQGTMRLTLLKPSQYSYDSQSDKYVFQMLLLNDDDDLNYEKSIKKLREAINEVRRKSRKRLSIELGSDDFFYLYPVRGDQVDDKEHCYPAEFSRVKLKDLSRVRVGLALASLLLGAYTYFFFPDTCFPGVLFGAFVTELIEILSQIFKLKLRMDIEKMMSTAEEVSKSKEERLQKLAERAESFTRSKHEYDF